MFSMYHMLWLLIAAALVVIVLTVLLRRQVPLRTVLTMACVAAVLSEVVKVFNTIDLVPSQDGSMLFPYLKPQELPLHLCSMQILLIFYARFAKEGPRRTAVLAFMYPTCFLGGIAALAIPSIYSANMVAPSQSFTQPLAYQFFLYHTMLVALGLYIVASRQVALRPRHYWSTMGLLGTLAFVSLYLNSMFAGANYENGALMSVDYTPNFMFTYQPPIPIQLTTLGQWYVYLAVMCLIACVLIGLCYVPVWLRDKRKNEHHKNDRR